MYYHYSGRRAISVGVEGGDAIVLRPNAKIEIRIKTKEISDLISKGLLKPTSPNGATPRTETVFEKAVLPKSGLGRVVKTKRA